MENYNKIIESIQVRFQQAEHMRLLQPVTLSHYHFAHNSLLKLFQGTVLFNGERLQAGELLFIPAGTSLDLTFGEPSRAPSVDQDIFMASSGFYMQAHTDIHYMGLLADSFGYVSFDANVFDEVDFFSALEISPFVIPGEAGLDEPLKRILQEESREEAGKDRLIGNKTEEIAISLIRYMLQNHLFVEQLVTNSTYFNDPRLLKIYSYIKANIGGDLSNKVLADVVSISEDYVGAYFKQLTGINPQDYIEYQRMETALELLRTTRKTIKEIGNEVGYKDTAYFCRRFKMMFGIPAAKMRRRESLTKV